MNHGGTETQSQAKRIYTRGMQNKDPGKVEIKIKIRIMVGIGKGAGGVR